MPFDYRNPVDHGLDTGAFETAWLSIVRASEAQQFGGAVALVLHRGAIVLHRATGWAVREPEADRSPMGVDVIFDLASLTKVAATTPSILRLVADGRLDLDAPIGAVLTEFSTGGGTDGPIGEVTIRRLMTHTAGFTSWIPVFLRGVGPDAYLAEFAASQPEHPVGGAVIYSDPSFITLGEVVRRITGESVAEYARREIFEPLGMPDTMFTPPRVMRTRIAGTEVGNAFEADKEPERQPAGGPWRDYPLRGEVHDGNAWYGFGGVAGHAGLFGTAIDLARYGQMWLNGGELDGVRMLPAALAAEARRNHVTIDGETERRALGWRMVPDPPSDAGDNESGRGLSDRAFGHTGFTGTSLWIDPARDLVIVLLTNRVHPTVTSAYLPTRAAFTAAIAGAVPMAEQPA